MINVLAFLIFTIDYWAYVRTGREAFNHNVNLFAAMGELVACLCRLCRGTSVFVRTMLRGSFRYMYMHNLIGSSLNVCGIKTFDLEVPVESLGTIHLLLMLVVQVASIVYLLQAGIAREGMLKMGKKKMGVYFDRTKAAQKNSADKLETVVVELFGDKCLEQLKSIEVDDADKVPPIEAYGFMRDMMAYHPEGEPSYFTKKGFAKRFRLTAEFDDKTYPQREDYGSPAYHDDGTGYNYKNELDHLITHLLLNTRMGIGVIAPKDLGLRLVELEILNKKPLRDNELPQDVLDKMNAVIELCQQDVSR